MLPRPVLLLSLFLAAAACAAPARGALELKSWLGSSYTLPGEESELWLTVTTDTRPAKRPVVPESEHITFKFLGDPIFPGTTQERTYVYRYAVVSYDEGTHVIPPFEIDIEGTPLRSQPLQLHVAPLPEDAWFEHEIRGKNVRVASRVCLPGRARFEGETTPAEVKIYLPAQFRIEKGSIAELAHDGVAAERFNISSLILPSNILVTTARINQQEYSGVTYRSTVTPLHGGEVSIGPGEARLTVETRVSTRGFTDSVLAPLEIPVGKRTFNARPLPKPAPEGFRNAVGRFSLSAQADTKGLREEDPISLRLIVTGTGNLDTLAPPEITASPAEWKSYPAHRLPRQGARSDATGITIFSQVIRPNGLRDAIPAYRLVSFDPENEQYTTLTTPPIPIDLTPANESSSPAGFALPDLSTPVEDMEGVLGLVDPLRGHPSSGLTLSYSWHILPALLAVILLIQLARRRLLSRTARPARAEELEQALEDLQRSSSNSRHFLRATGSFVEAWIPANYRDDQTYELLARRDRSCYQPEDLGTQVSKEERHSILIHLRKRALEALSVMAILFCLSPGTSHGASSPKPAEYHYEKARAAWDNSAFLPAINHYLDAHGNGSFPADVLYNIGNCYFHLGERGLAMLYYRRALHQSPGHPEAKQNMGFLKRKTGAITIERPAYQEHLGSLSRSFYQNLALAGGWLILLSTLTVLKGARMHRLPWAGLSAGILLVFTGGMALFLYPSDIEFAPAEDSATMINKVSILAGTEAATIAEQGSPPQGSRKVIEVPPGSLCRPLATRGPWTYVEFANKIRGWVPSRYVRSMLPIEDERPASPEESA